MRILQGIDLIKIKRVCRIYSKFKNKFLHRIFTNKEIRQITKNEKKMMLRIAGKFASKEAAAKAIGLGISNGIKFKDFEILNNENGKPEIKLTGEAQNRINKIISSSVALSHDGEYLISVVTFISNE